MNCGRPGCAVPFANTPLTSSYSGTLLNLEERQVTYETTHAILEKHPDLAGIYCVGGGMEGAIAALRESGRADEVMLVVNELTDKSREALQDGTV